MIEKTQDLAGPGIGSYTELENILPPGLSSNSHCKRDTGCHYISKIIHRRLSMQKT